MLNYKNGLRGHHQGERWATQKSFHVEGFTQEQITSYVDYIGTLEGINSCGGLYQSIGRSMMQFKGSSPL